MLSWNITMNKQLSTDNTLQSVSTLWWRIIQPQSLKNCGVLVCMETLIVTLKLNLWDQWWRCLCIQMAVFMYTDGSVYVYRWHCLCIQMPSDDGVYVSALSFPDADLWHAVISENQLLKLYFSTLRWTILVHHSNEFNLWLVIITNNKNVIVHS